MTLELWSFNLRRHVRLPARGVFLFFLPALGFWCLHAVCSAQGRRHVRLSVGLCTGFEWSCGYRFFCGLASTFSVAWLGFVFYGLLVSVAEVALLLLPLSLIWSSVLYSLREWLGLLLVLLHVRHALSRMFVKRLKTEAGSLFWIRSSSCSSGWVSRWCGRRGSPG
ncbi:hypothetical protein Bca101_047235 [Brassica carinata]